MNIADLRNEFTKAELTLESVDKFPSVQFEKWFKEAINAKLLEPNAMVLSTVDVENAPSQRTVLMKAYDENGFVFYTNLESKKSKQITGNPYVSLLFPWYALERQVIISGTAVRVPTTQSISYFATRPRGSQLGAWVSQQSQVISNRSILETKLAEMQRKFKEGKIPLPDFWGGYRVIPTSIEFWQGRPNRLHDRIFYEKSGDEWTVSRLSP